MADMLMFAPHTAVTDAHSISHLNALCSSDTTTPLLLIYNYCQTDAILKLVFFILTTSQRNIHHNIILRLGPDKIL